VLSPDQVSKELEQARQGVFVQLSREEFEDRVQQAARAAETRKKLPRLVEARYRATLQDRALVGGGQWTILNPAEEPGVFPVQPFNLALRRARLGKSDAVLGELAGKDLGVLLPGSGRHQLTLDWSARGDLEAGELRFKLDVPACALTSFELELPADRVVEVSRRDKCLVSGPRPASAPGWHLWQLHCPEFSPIDLLIRQVAGANQPPPLVRALLQTRQILTPDRVEADFTFNLEVWHGSIRELVWECDPSLRALDVRVRNRELESWEQRPGAIPDAPSMILVRLAEPFQGQSLTLTIHGLAPLSAGAPWTCPGLRLAGAVLRGETLALQVAPEIELEDWQPGDFELVKLQAETRAGQTLTLQSASQNSGSESTVTRRPSARLRLQRPEFRSRQLLWWQVRPAGSLLTAQLTCEMVRGQLFRVPVFLPSGWTADRVDAAPVESVRQWTVQSAENGQNVLMVEMLRPLEAGSSGQWTVHLRAIPNTGDDKHGERAPEPLAFPMLTVEGARYAEGGLGISLDPSYRGTTETSFPAAMAPTAAPWGTQPLDYYYPFQGQAVTGWLHLHPRPPRVGAQCTSEVIVASGQASLRTRLVIRPAVGNPNTVDLWLSAPVASSWNWEVRSGRNEVRSMKRLTAVELAPRLLPLGAANPLEAIVLSAIRARRGTAWRLTLAQPLQEPLTLEAAFDLNTELRAREMATRLGGFAARTPFEQLGLAARARRAAEGPVPDRQWEVPLALVLGADRMAGEARLHLAGVDRVRVEAEGLQEMVENAEAGPASVWRSYRYDQGPVSLVLRGQLTNAEPPELALAISAQLTTYLDPTGPMLHSFRFRVQSWKQHYFPLRLPKGTRFLAARIDGHWISSLAPAQDDEDAPVVALPVPATAASPNFEVFYSSPVPVWKLWTKLEAPAPVLPIRTAAFRRTWFLSTGLVPLHAESFHRGDSQGNQLGRREDSLASPSAPETHALSPLENAQRFPGEAWEPLAGIPAEESLVVIRREGWPVLAGTLTALLLLISWRCRRWPARRRYGLLLVWLAGAGLAWLWLPQPLRSLAAWPLLAGFGVAACWYLWSALGRQDRLPARLSPAVASAFLALVATGGLPGWAAGPEPYVVRLVPGPAGSPGKQTALVSPELLRELKSMAGLGVGDLQGACLLGAHYEGTVANGSAEFTAVMRSLSFTAEPCTLKLPFGGIELQEAFLDGAIAYPEALPLPQAGYSLRLTGKGPHTIRLRFTVPVAQTGEDHELRFAIPELVQSQLRLTAPAAAKYLQDVQGQGAQRLRSDSKSVHLEVDLGRAKVVQVRWLQEKPQPAVASMQVNEVYLWNLKAGDDRLLGILQYRRPRPDDATVSQGAMATFPISLPQGLEVRRVEVAPLQGGGPVPHLKEWRITGPANQRRLIVELQVPVTNGVQIFLDLVPSKPFGASVVLPLPTPEEATFAGESFIGYRVEGRQAELVQYLGVTGLHPEEFALNWQSAGVDDPGPPERAYRFQRGPGAAPLLRLNLRVPRIQASCTQELAWSLAAGRIDLHAAGRLTAPPEQLMLTEWDVPIEVTVTNVSGPSLRSWSRTGSRIQVWLQPSSAGPALETLLELNGWMAAPPAGPKHAFKLPQVHIIGATSQWTFVRVAAERGLALEPTELQNLWPLPDSRSSPSNRSYLSKEASYRATFEVHPATSDVEVRLLTLAELEARDLSFTTLLDFRVKDGELRTFTVHLRNAEGAEVRFEADRMTNRHEQRLDLADQVWAFELQPGVTGSYQVKLHGRMPLGTVGEVTLPAVRVEGATTSERWLAVAGQHRPAEPPRALTTVADALKAFSDWPAATSKLKQAGSSAWRIDADDWMLRLRTRLPEPAARPIQVLLEEQSAAVLDGRRWVHQARYWLYHEAGSELLVHLPHGSRLLRLTLDGNDVAPLEFDPEQVWLPLTGGGLRSLQLSWAFEDNREQLDQPDLTRPRLDDAVPVGPEQPRSSLWTVYLPTGYQLVEPGKEAQPALAAAVDLRRAAALLQLSNRLAGRLSPRVGDSLPRLLTAVEREFYRLCQSVEPRLTATENSASGRHQEAELKAQYQQLREANQQLAQKYSFETIRLEAEKHAGDALATTASAEVAIVQRALNVEDLSSGTPTYWRAGENSLVPRLRLVAFQFQHSQQALGFSGLILVVLLIAWLVSYFPQPIVWAKALWPEQVALLGGLGWLFLGYNPVFAFLVLLGVSARLVYLGRWGLTSQQRTSAAVVKPTNGAS
jgi:hypothetical protein